MPTPNPIPPDWDMSLPLTSTDLRYVWPRLRPLVAEWLANGKTVDRHLALIDLSPLTDEEEAWVEQIAREETP